MTIKIDEKEYTKLLDSYADLVRDYLEIGHQNYKLREYMWHLNYALWAYITKYGNKLTIPKYLMEANSSIKYEVAVTDNGGNLDFVVSMKFMDEDENI